jgi:hypothetical protein
MFSRFTVYSLPNLFPFALFFFSCTTQRTEPELQALMRESLVNSTNEIRLKTNRNMYSLKQKYKEPASHSVAIKFYMKASKLMQLCSEFSIYIDQLRTDISNGNPRHIDSLYIRIKEFQSNVLSIDKELQKYIREEVTRHTTLFAAIRKSQSLSALSAEDQQLYLITLDNNLARMESVVIEHYDNNISNHIDYDSFSAIVGQNTKYLKSGDTLEITAGMGAFTTAAKPSVFINNKLVKNESGVSVLKMKILGRPGKHTVPVRISYHDENGERQYAYTNLEYTIIK